MWTTIGVICLSGVTAFVGLFCLGGYLVLFGPPDAGKYNNSGKDQVAHFGEGRFVIGKTDKLHRFLYDRDTNTMLMSNVVDWREKGDYAYVSSTDGKYVVIQSITSDYWMYTSIDDVPAEHQAQSRKLRVSR